MKQTIEEAKDLAYYKTNAEEDYLRVPISVLRYISELEQEIKRMYSEQEVYNMIIDLLKRKQVGQIIDYGDIHEWFEQYYKIK